jgi:hypothetical protein
MKLPLKKICRALAFMLLFASPIAQANNIQSFSASQTSVAPGTPVIFTIELGKASESVIVRCGVKLNFGDGTSSDIRLDEKDSPTLKFTRELAYKNPGKYTVILSGNGMRRGLNSVLACDGQAKQVIIEVVDIEKMRMQQELTNIQKHKEEADKARQSELEAKKNAAEEKALELERKLKALEGQSKNKPQQAPSTQKPSSPSSDDGSNAKKSKADSIL